MHDIENNVFPAKPNNGCIVQFPIFGFETVVTDRLFINVYFGSNNALDKNVFFFYYKSNFYLCINYLTINYFDKK